MAIHSMTGFARAQGIDAGHSWAWEVKSVNGKSLDIRCRLAPGQDAIEGPARDRIAAKLRRGSVSAALSLTRVGAGERVAVNQAALEQLLDLRSKYAGRIDAGPPRLEALLQVRGVVEAAAEDEDDEARVARQKAILATLDEALDRLVVARRAEGERLHEILRQQIEAIRSLGAAARSLAATQPERFRLKLQDQLKLLLDARPPVGEDRLAQELAMLILRGDVREEIDRLEAHCESAAEVLAQGGVVGRRLDFLSQEFNREANTLCSKSSDVELTRIGLALKGAIDQFREQVQNIE
jgi:uncharacterized protein (TIGR00255 family)